MLPNNNKSQAGNVFILILAGVFLFGALMFTFSRSADKGSGNLTKQQAKIAAQEIINYARLVEGAVDRVRRNGCSENEISFDNAVVSGYSNTNSPGDNSCHVFEPEGGKIEYQKIPEQYRWEGNSAWYLYGVIEFRRGHNVIDIGTPNEELLLKGFSIKKDVCLAINELVGVENPSNTLPRDDTSTASIKYTGSFSGVVDTMGDESNEIKGKYSFCRTSVGVGITDPVGQFVHVLLAR